MRNSVETESSSPEKRGFSLFSIDEHRLSLGLLALTLLAGAGYGIWLVLSPFLPNSIAAEVTESRNQIADTHYRNKDWTSAISVYNEMLEDDPDNGFVLLKTSTAWANRLAVKWDEITKLREANPDAEFSEEFLADELRIFEQTTKSWTKLTDSARYRRQAFERIASLHSLRSQRMNDPDELDKAIAVLQEMFENDCTTLRGIKDTQSLRPLRSYKRFSNLVLEEQRLERKLEEQRVSNLLN